MVLYRVPSFYLNVVGYKVVILDPLYHHFWPFYLNVVGYKVLALSSFLSASSVLSERSGI